MFLIALAIAGAPFSLAPQPEYSGYLPSRSVTPGAVNPAVTQSNIGTTICRAGWTKTIRPPVSYTNKLKLTQMKALALPGAASLYEEDHFLPLEVGGNPTAPANLWPQKWAEPWGAHRKDVVETKVKRLICAGKLSLSEAQNAIRTDWIAAYLKYVGPLK